LTEEVQKFETIRRRFLRKILKPPTRPYGIAVVQFKFKKFFKRPKQLF